MPEIFNTQNAKPTLVLRLISKIPFAGLVCTVLAGACYTAGKLLIKKSDTIHPAVYVGIRGFAITIFYGIIVLCKRVSLTADNKKQFFGLCGNGFFAFLTFITLYTALWLIPLGDSNTLLMTSTIFTSILARIFLGEKLTVMNIIYIALTMVGVVLIAEPPSLGFEYIGEIRYNNKLFGITLSLIGAFSAASCYVFLRYLKGVDVDLIVAYLGGFCFFGNLICFPFIKKYGDNSDTIKMPGNREEWTYTIFISLTGIIAEFLLSCSFQLENANYIAIIRCGDIIMAFLAEYAFMPEDSGQTHWNTYLGAAIILLTVILTTVSKISNEKKEDNMKIKKEETVSYQHNC